MWRLLVQVFRWTKLCAPYIFVLACPLPVTIFGLFLMKGDRLETMPQDRLTSSAGNQKQSPLQITLTTDSDSYRMGDSITVNVLLTNRSRDPLYLYAALDWGESSSLSLWLKDAVSGKDLTGDFWADALSPPPGSKDAFIKLLPDHIYGVVLKTSLADLNVNKKGRYEVVVEYHSPVPSTMGFGLPIRGREMGKLSSKPVTITVSD